MMCSYVQIEAGLDRASVAVPAIKAITTLVLKPAAQGLEPRIVRLIIEKVEQVCQQSLGLSEGKALTQ